MLDARLNRSLAEVWAWRRSASGEAWSGVSLSIAAVAASEAGVRAMPKSASAGPYWPRRMFCGFTSRWRMSALCAAWRAWPILTPMSITSFTGSGPPALRIAE
jgi:hypothetical protein